MARPNPVRNVFPPPSIFGKQEVSTCVGLGYSAFFVCVTLYCRLFGWADGSLCATGQLFGAAQQQGFGAAPQFAGAGAAGLSSVLAGSAYDAQQQQQQQHQQQLQQQSSWLNSSGFYMGGDRQPQAPPQPSGLGFYTRDSQSLEAQLLAQAYQSHLGAANNSSYGGLGAPGNMPGYLNHPGSVLGRLSEPALPAPGGGSWMAAGLGLGQQTAGGYGSLAQPSLQSLGYSAQPQSPWALPGAASTASFGAAGLGHATAPSFPQQRAADQTAGGLVLNGQHLEQQQPHFQQFQPEQSLASLSNAELQQRLALMSAGGGLGQGWASAVPSPAGMLGVGVTTSSGVEAAASLPQQAFPGDALMKQARQPLTVGLQTIQNVFSGFLKLPLQLYSAAAISLCPPPMSFKRFANGGSGQHASVL